MFWLALNAQDPPVFVSGMCHHAQLDKLFKQAEGKQINSVGEKKKVDEKEIVGLARQLSG